MIREKNIEIYLPKELKLKFMKLKNQNVDHMQSNIENRLYNNNKKIND